MNEFIALQPNHEEEKRARDVEKDKNERKFPVIILFTHFSLSHSFLSARQLIEIKNCQRFLDDATKKLVREIMNKNKKKLWW